MNPKGILAICVGYGVGIWCSVLAIKRWMLFHRALGWLSTRGRIIESTLYKDPKRRNATHFRVRYEFSVGERFEGDTPRIAGGWFWNSRQQSEFVARFTPGQEVEVFYDSREPRQNCLDRTDRSGIAVLWILAIGATLLATLLVWLLFVVKSDGDILP